MFEKRYPLGAGTIHVLAEIFLPAQSPVIDLIVRELDKPIATFYRYLRNAQIASSYIGVILCAPSQVF
jgi:hypothetical protein